ncbi:MAG: glycosyltransferase [Candidatus Aminicenantes bacterium]|nr:glycosyltransferase [Candidatus Aminicenantes bacterium]
MTPMKVLISAYACNPLGSQALHPGEDLTGWRLVNQVARFHEVWVLTHAYNRPGVEQALGAASGPGRIHFHYLDLPRPLGLLYKVAFGERIYYYLWQIRAWRAARGLHRKVGFDIAHHATFGNDWIPSYIGAFLPVPYVHGPVGGGQRTPRGLMAEYTLAGRLAERGRNAAQWLGRRDPVRRRCLRRARAVLVCNNETRAKVPRPFVDKAVFFPVNGISREDLGPAAVDERPAGPLRVFTAGRFHRLKGFALAIRGFAVFFRDHPGASFVIVGSGDEEKSLRRLVRELGVEASVRIEPWLPRTELLRRMRASDVFLFPSFRDGGGAVVVEAMASSLPVVAIDSGGPGVHVEPAWGFRIEPRGGSYVASEIARALAALADSPGSIREMGRAGRRRAEEFYLWDKHGERLRDIYARAAAGQD